MSELRLDRLNEFLQSREVSVVGAEPSSDLPDALDGIEFGTVRRQKIQHHPAPARLEPGAEEAGVMIRSVVHDQM